MKFSIVKEKFLEPLADISGIVARKTTKPILSHALLQAGADNSLLLKGTDTEVTLQILLHELNVQDAGAITVPAAKLLDVVRHLPAQATIYCSLEKEQLLVKAAGSLFRIATLPAEDFPALAEADMERRIETESRALHDIMQKVKRIFQANKAGHTGALDPLATGMLPICLGEATKFSQFLLDADKRYLVTAKLGERTDTSDAEGQIVETRDVNVKTSEILTALEQFRGDILQVPTMFSALKYNGKPLYEYARQGITVEREARPITIFELNFIEYNAPYLTLEVHCSKGTYIRTLVDDLGEVLDCGAHVTMLRRTAVADYPTEKMLDWHALQSLTEQQDLALLDALLLPMDTAVAKLPALTLNESQTQGIGFGQRIKFDNLNRLQGQVRLFSHENRFLGVAVIDENNVIRPQRLVVY